MASSRERKKEVDRGNPLGTNMPRGSRAQLEIYTPGSGPLRKSGRSGRDLNSEQDPRSRPRRDSPLNDEGSMGDRQGGDSRPNDRRKSRKPEQPLYVPTPVAKARESEQRMTQPQQGRQEVNNEWNLNGNNNPPGNERINAHPNKSKRYSNRRRPNDADIQEEWRGDSPNRNFRQGSEPRAAHPHNANTWSRMRDTRSVEPQVNVPNRGYLSEKSHMKPPSGRRHSTIGVEPDKRQKFQPNMDHVPPRFRKKYLDPNKMGGSGNPVEDSWDGSSITFQGSSQHGYHQNYMSNQHVTPNNKIYCTLPSRPRGRGRLQQEQHNNPGGVFRSVTPEKMFANSPVNSRPGTPLFAGRTRSNESLNRPDSRSQTPVNVYRNDNRYEQSNRYEPRSESNNRYEKGNENARFEARNENARFEGRNESNNRFEKGNENARFEPRNENARFEGRNEGNRFEARNENGRFNARNEGSHFVAKNEGGRFEGRNERGRFEHRNENSRFGARNEKRGNNGHSRNDNYGNSRNNQKQAAAFRESLEAQLSPVSPVTPEETFKVDSIAINNDILDWSEEVEQHVKNLEAEALSDAMTRSSSMASLMETSTKSLPANPKSKSKRKKNRKKRSGSNQRDLSMDNQSKTDEQAKHGHSGSASGRRQRQNSHTSVDNFKVPEQRGQRRPSRDDNRDRSFDRTSRSKNVSRESSFDRNRKSSCSEQENWREEIMRTRNSSEHEVVAYNIKKNPEREEPTEVKKAGLIHLPQPAKDVPRPPVLNMSERPKLPEIQRKSAGQKTLFDPNNPHTPIVINKPNSRVGCPSFSDNSDALPPQPFTTDQYGNIRPSWHNDQSESFKQCHYPNLLIDIRKADNELQIMTNSEHLLSSWTNVYTLRSFLMDSLEYLLSKDLKFSQTENIEQYFWRILYHNITEMMRKALANDPEHKEKYKMFLLKLIDEGTCYYERLLDRLETTYEFKLGDYLGANSHRKATGYVNLALISAQKIFINLGDLWRYREQVNETSNYGKCRQMYLKAHEINPKNGRPYNQLAVLAVYSRKKLDAVYYYMRSLMSTNPVQSAKESLNSLFDENRKKYEHGERKRREERQERARLHMKEKESQQQKNKLRTMTWIHPEGGRRIRTTSTLPEAKPVDSEEDDLAKLTSVEVNKRFVTSYLHVHGKLINKIGMETFQETALQMLKEFRALLQHSPVPLPSTRFLQLLALNMFAIESTQLKDPQLLSGLKAEQQERALIVSLQMFNLILEKCLSLISDYITISPDGTKPIPHDVHELLPSVKVWCDWMLCHTNIWNPPPSTQDFRVGPAGDAWSRLATLMNLLEKLGESTSPTLVDEPNEGYEQIRLPEDAALSGFTPLNYTLQKPMYVDKNTDMETAQFAARVSQLVFFGTIFLCGLEPPVLKLEYQDDFREYVSVVCTSASRSAPNTPPEFNENELLVETLSEEDEGIADSISTSVEGAPSEIQELLTRKVELEKRQRDQELHRQTVQKILQQSVLSVVIEVKPKNLVPDTNCFIDYLSMLRTIASSSTYTLMVPLIVLNELEGLAKGSKSPVTSPRSSVDATHSVKVAESAKQALSFLSNKQPNVKCITTKGTILTSAVFTKEDDTLVDVNMTNDDRILATCMTLCKGASDQIIGEPRKLFRDVVLLTEDRNLRVKAVGSDVPVSEVPRFLQWAGLG